MNNNKTAVLVIDVQNAIFPIWRQSEVLFAINALVLKAEEAGLPVIYVYHSADGLVPGEWGWFIHEGIRLPVGHEQIRKRYASAFIGTELEALLDTRFVGRIVVCGLASEACVNSTLLSAKDRGYDIILASDAHSTSMSGNELQPRWINERWNGLGAEVLPEAEIHFSK